MNIVKAKKARISERQRRQTAVEKARKEEQEQTILFAGSLFSGILADLDLVGVGEEFFRLYRAGDFVRANQLAVRSIERKFQRPGEESDVSIYFGIRKGLGTESYHCCNCLLAGGSSDFSSRSVPEMIGHLRKHEVAGHAVPKLTAARLRSSALR